MILTTSLCVNGSEPMPVVGNWIIDAINQVHSVSLSFQINRKLQIVVIVFTFYRCSVICFLCLEWICSIGSLKYKDMSVT